MSRTKRERPEKKTTSIKQIVIHMQDGTCITHKGYVLDVEIAGSFIIVNCNNNTLSGFDIIYSNAVVKNINVTRFDNWVIASTIRGE